MTDGHFATLVVLGTFAFCVVGGYFVRWMKGDL